MSCNNASKVDNFFGQENPSPSLFVLVRHHVVMTSRQRTRGHMDDPTQYTRVFMSRHCQNPSVCATRTCVLSMCPLEKVSTSILAHGALGILYRNFKAMLCQASVSTQQSCPFLKTSPDIQLLARHNGIYVVYNPDWIFDDF